MLLGCLSQKHKIMSQLIQMCIGHGVPGLHSCIDTDTDHSKKVLKLIKKNVEKMKLIIKESVERMKLINKKVLKEWS